MAPIKLPEPAVKTVVPQRQDMGPTEDQVDMGGTLPQRIDDKGTKVEDEAGTGEIDSNGG